MRSRVGPGSPTSLAWSPPAHGMPGVAYATLYPGCRLPPRTVSSSWQFAVKPRQSAANVGCMCHGSSTISQIKRLASQFACWTAQGMVRGGKVDRELVVVQIPHLRQEHDPGDAIVMPWSPRGHGRKSCARPANTSAPAVSCSPEQSCSGEVGSRSSALLDATPKINMGILRFAHDHLSRGLLTCERGGRQHRSGGV
jgi:hypothetical protein